MSPERNRVHLTHYRFPRVSGDEPRPGEGGACRVEFSPRERG